MITREPEIKVALLQKQRHAAITLNGSFYLSGDRQEGTLLDIQSSSGQVIVRDASGKETARQPEVFLRAADKATFTLDVEIGIDFHWQRTCRQTFRGNIIIRANPDSSFCLINEIHLEDYLASVISSEMSAQAPREFLKAQAITARSWLVAMLERKKENKNSPEIEKSGKEEIIRWHDTNDHASFDVCADDHCQRYQGISLTSANTEAAAQTTRGIYLVYNNEICDARYYKSCGGRTEVFPTAWEDKNLPYLQSITDNNAAYPPLQSADDVRKWLMDKPAAYCNTADQNLLREILPSFDQETIDFYRWRVIYRREDLEKIICRKSGLDTGELQAIIPLERGPSGRISKLKIEGTKRTVIVGKELEIRRWLSPSHLLSSAFVVTEERSATGAIERFILDGGGWGHGVGLCQIGAAVMAAKGFRAEDILAHYFSGALLQKLYE